MPRQARLVAPGTLHHVMVRGIEGIDIFRTDKDRNGLLQRLAAYSAYSGHSFRCKPAAVPNESGHLLRFNPATSLSERSDAGV